MITHSDPLSCATSSGAPRVPSAGPEPEQFIYPDGYRRGFIVSHSDPRLTARPTTGLGHPITSAVPEPERFIYPDGYVRGPNPSVDALRESLEKQWLLREEGPALWNNDDAYQQDSDYDHGRPEAGPSNRRNAYHGSTPAYSTGSSGTIDSGFDPLNLPEHESDKDNIPQAIHEELPSLPPNPPSAPPGSLRSGNRPPLVLNTVLQPRSTERLWDPETRQVNFVFDLRHPHDGILLPSPQQHVIRIPSEMEDQPATIPPCTYLRVVHPALRWTIHVRAGTWLHPEDTPPGRGGKAQQRRLDYVSVIDVLREICLTLHKPLPRAEFELLHVTPEERKHTTMAFYQRCRYMHLNPGYGNQEEKGMRRVDVLGVRVSFIGLVPTKTYGQFRMILADRAREMAPFGARQVDLMMPLEGEPEAAGYDGPIPWGYKDPGTVWGLLEWYKIIMPPWEQELEEMDRRARECQACEDTGELSIQGLGLETIPEEAVQGLGLELG